MPTTGLETGLNKMSQKAIFLDRDGTLTEDPGYVSHPDQIKLLDGVPEALIQLKALGYKLIVASNQSGVARGIVSEEVLAEIHNRLKELLAEKGAYLDQIYYCPYHPDGAVARYRKHSSWRKPAPGMLLAAADEMDIDLARSWVIGNSDRDIEAGLQAGCQTIMVSPPYPFQPTGPPKSKPHYKAVNIREAVNIIKMRQRSACEPADQSQPVPAKQSPPPAAPQPTPATDEPIPEAEAAEQAEVPQTDEQDSPAPQKEAYTPTADRLLGDILEQLRTMQRADMFGEFSIMRLLAGAAQVAALFCLVLSVWLLLAPSRQDTVVLIALAFAVLLQVMSLTFYTMQGRK